MRGQETPRRVVIIGGGFGGLYAAKDFGRIHIAGYPAWLFIHLMYLVGFAADGDGAGYIGVRERPESGDRKLLNFRAILQPWPVSGARAHAIFLTDVGHNLDRDLAESFIGIRSGIVSHGVTIA